MAKINHSIGRSHHCACPILWCWEYLNGFGKTGPYAQHHSIFPISISSALGRLKHYHLSDSQFHLSLPPFNPRHRPSQGLWWKMEMVLPDFGSGLEGNRKTASPAGKRDRLYGHSCHSRCCLCPYSGFLCLCDDHPTDVAQCHLRPLFGRRCHLLRNCCTYCGNECDPKGLPSGGLFET